MSRTYFSIGIVRREDVPPAHDKPGCVGLVVESCGSVSEVRSVGGEWIVEKRHPPKVKSKVLVNPPKVPFSQLTV